MAGVSERATTTVVAEASVRVERSVEAARNSVHADLSISTTESVPVNVRVVDPLPRVYSADSVRFDTGSEHSAGSTSTSQIAGEVLVPAKGQAVMRYTIDVVTEAPGIGLTKVSSLIQPQIEGATPADTPVSTGNIDQRST